MIHFSLSPNLTGVHILFLISISLLNTYHEAGMKIFIENIKQGQGKSLLLLFDIYIVFIPFSWHSKYHKLGCFKQRKFVLSNFWKLEV